MTMTNDERRDTERLLAGGPGPHEREQMFAVIEAGIAVAPAPRRRGTAIAALSAFGATAAVAVFALNTTTPPPTPLPTTPPTTSTKSPVEDTFVPRGTAPTGVRCLSGADPYENMCAPKDLVIRGSVEGQVVGEGDHNGSHVLVRCPTAGCSASTDVDIWITPPAAGAVVHLAALQDDGTAIWLPTSTTPLTKQVQIAATLPAGHVRFYVVSGPQIARDDARAAIEANTALQFAFDVAP